MKKKGIWAITNTSYHKDITLEWSQKWISWVQANGWHPEISIISHATKLKN
jgi:hypothetical protein